MSIEHSEGDIPKVDPNEAEIKQVRPDTVIVGVKHNIDINSLATPQTRFQEIVKSAEHLLLEAPRETHEHALDSLQSGEGPLDYEIFAYSQFLDRGKKDDIYCLEDGENTDSFSLGQRYGLPLKDHVLLSAAGYFYNTYKHVATNDPHELGDLQSDVKNFYESFPVLSGLPPDELKNWLSTLTEDARVISEDPKFYLRRFPHYLKKRQVMVKMLKLIRAGGEVQNYMSSVRDYEVLGPKASSLAESLEGNKVIIVGKNHVPNVERALRREEIQKPLPWPDYVRSLDRRTRRDIAVLDSIPVMPRREE